MLTTAVQLPEKNGLDVAALMLPSKPALHVHPEATLVPVESDGQPTAAQRPQT